MSNRALKKVFGSDELKKIGTNSEDEEPVDFANPKRGGFSFLADQDESESDPESEAKESEGQEPGGQPDGDEAGCGHQNKKKKKRKKSTSKIKKRDPNYSSEFTTEDEGIARQHERELKLSHLGKKEPKECHNRFDEIFKIDPKFLNPEVELRKIFGSKAIHLERGKKGQRRIYSKNSSKLIAPKAEWPPVTGSGISMSFLDSKNGTLYFKFEHNDNYRSVQKAFMKAVDSLDPDNIVAILRENSYHVDAHIQLSDMAKAAEDMQVATELIEGALYCLEHLFHVRFNITLSNCRLEYKYQENRAFHILLFKHLIFVGQRACHRTALELCKRLLTLDPEQDPLCVTLMVDFYAIKSGEYQWLIELYQFWESRKRNLSQLPNWAYSIALAHHLYSLKKEGEEAEELSQKADKLIQYALLMFPLIFLPLIEKCSVQTDNRAKNHSYFNMAEEKCSRGLKLLASLYIHRSHHLWKETTVLPWLEKNVKIILDQVDGKAPVVKEYEEKRSRRYQGTPRNVLRHVLLTDVKELSIHLPKELANEPILNYDPLPPTDSINIYNVKRVRETDPTLAQRGGILSMLFRSLLYDLNQPANRWQFHFDDENPQIDDNGEAEFRIRAVQNPNFAQNNPEGAGALEGEGAVGGQNNAAGGLGQSVTALLEAMRNLLTDANQQPIDATDENSEEELLDIDD